jgi:hypothetical protein
MNEELDKIEKNDTWELVPRPKNKNVIGVDTERGVNQYQVQFKNLFQLILKPFNYIQ